MYLLRVCLFKVEALHFTFNGKYFAHVVMWNVCSISQIFVKHHNSAGRVVQLLDYSQVVIANRTRIRVLLLLN